jgi:two-component system sensor histidine kinase/response regulator
MSAPVKCLLVDDLEDNLMVLQALLRSDDVELLLARSGVEALNLLLDHEVALALVDVQMPEMDGFELAELMRGSLRTRDVPIIFVTAGVRDQHRVFRGYESGAVDFLFKPVDPDILKNKAEVFFQLYRQKQQIAQELQARTETLRLNEMFAAVLGHDLRSPLQAITNAAHVIARTTQEPTALQAASQIVGSSRRMGRMIADLLDLSRSRVGGGIPVSPQPHDLRPILERVVEEQQQVHPARSIHVHISGDVAAFCDADRIAQVLSNLIGNALQHGTADAPVTVEATGVAEGVQVTVANAGALDRAIVEHVFDPFRAGTQRANHSEGLGLGLYIAQQIVHAHGGTISVDAAADTTAFRIVLPRSGAGPAP